ncbi:MAG TPA: flagellar hook assembly protein FlgD, partial [Polyangiaceae bacterium]|nr:flagellar hook assembly protein FlgD [Polyangiaceae bacterium]
MVASVNSTTTANNAADLSKALGNNPAMGRDAFLKLLVAQLKNQDPLKPQDNSAFVAELAQFSSLEQSMGVNDRLDQMMLQNQGMANADVVNMVGKNATVKGSLITTDGSGIGVPVAFTQDRVSDKTTVQIQDANGKIVRTLDLGSRPVGISKITWDGRSDDGIVQPAGTYAVSVKSSDADGGTVSVSQETTGTI